MRLLDGTLVLSPSDLTKFTRCAHATSLDVADLNGTLEKLAGKRRSLHTDFIVRKGTEFEEKYIEDLARAGNRVLPIKGDRGTAEDLRNVEAATLDAMRAGSDAIYQAVFFDGRWVGYADLLQRVDRPSTLGHWSYEVVDTKLARTPKAHFLLQLAAYSEQLERLQGLAPEQMHVVLGDRQKVSFRVSDFAAYFRAVRARFEETVRSGGTSTAPFIVDFCSLCEWSLHCWRTLERMDHLVRVANIRRDQVQRLESADIVTLTKLAETADAVVPKLRRESYATLHDQARLQSEQNRTGEHRYQLLPPEPSRGFELLPKPSQGDLFLDLEADPYAGDGLTYLFGLADADAGYRAWWADDPLQEKRAFEELVDHVEATRRTHPGMHLYHYTAAEPSALKRMSSEFGTREQQIDDWLRHHVFVDLYKVVRQAMRISQPSYSLKKLEAFYFQREEEGVFERGGPILAYEEWLETRDPETRQAIENYNREDCVSTVRLREWLLELRAEAEQQAGRTLQWFEREAEEQSQDAIDFAMQTDAISQELLRGLPDDMSGATEEERACWLLAHLVHYHRREARPAWWWYFERLDMTEEELIADHESLGGLVPADDIPPRNEQRSKIWTLRYPPQEQKIGDEGIDPATKKGVKVVRIDEVNGLVEIKRGANRTEPLPRALIPGKPFDTTKQRQMLRKIAQSILERGFDGSPYRAAVDILLRRPKADARYLFIQGPPGAGKTYTGARRIVDLLARRKRVGVTSNSHKAIHNLLDEVERVATDRGVAFTGLKKLGSGEESRYESRHVRTTSDFGDCTAPGVHLVAGTSWLFADERLEQTLDVIFIDEAGQIALANALVIAAAAREVVLLGDPLQLAQVSQAQHPGTSGSSVLEHLLGDYATIPSDRGDFLEKTHRMHPAVCRFISEVVYDGRLESARECSNRRVDVPRPEPTQNRELPERVIASAFSPLQRGEGGSLANARDKLRPDEGRRTLAGTGLRFLSVDHTGNSQASKEEAERIAAEIEHLLRATVTDKENHTRPISPADLMVVAPYNAQVRCITEVLRSRGLSAVPVGTVDKFQGREAEVVFYSMATSTGDDLPRDIDFLFSRNRLNVAVSRARCLAVVVASPRLLGVACRTPEQMRLLNALCRFVEMAIGVA